ncbi:ABC transporter ATP-binding protein [Haliangium sp.]|uniref:ABC transporter ATP-binding protein n=1 Tax=Haliangium sp. TaxID=2663208 RepID=UPI003D12142C
MANITLHSIAHSYTDGAEPGDFVLHDIELDWRDGGAYALLGPSGCGKTTLLNIMSGLVRPTQGRVMYRDESGERDVTDLPTRERNIAQVFQFPVIYDTMTVYDNLAFPLRNRGLRGPAIDRQVRHIAEALELTPVLRDKAIGLGMDAKQIISLGRGLVRDDVAAILFDEPLTIIDPQRKWILRRKLREIHRAFAHTLIYVTHDQTEALTFADEVVVMHEGRVVQQGSPQELFAEPAHTFVGYFIGSPGMNFFPCRIEAGAAVIAGHRVALPDDLAARAAERTGELVLGIRPEHVQVRAADEVAEPGETGDAADSGDAAEPGGLTVSVRHVEDHGRVRVVSATLGEHALKFKTASAADALAGGRCRIELPAAHVRLYENERLIA